MLATAGAGFASGAHAEATLLIEAESGRVLHAENAGQRWYPASVTKLMTLYVTLKAMKERRVSPDTLITVSPFAASQQPSKMGFKAGTQLTVDNALKMMMVKSANDIAVTLAEGVGGNYDKFLDEMNRSAARLGMTETSYVNANGLPADGQITSARDLGILARALIREMPEYNLYWHIPAIKLGRRVLRNYNTLIDRYPGADGMKTGFICASGFNLVASATRNGKQFIAVVLGAPSSRMRSLKAAQLLERAFETGTLSWLMPSRGTVESIPTTADPPPNLREEMCGKHRKRPATEEAEDDEPDSGISALASSLRPASSKPAELIGPLVESMPPIPVFVGPAKKPPATQVAAAPAARANAKAAVSELSSGATAGPMTLTAPAFAPASPAPWPSTFVPSAAAAPAPRVVANVPMPRPRPHLRPAAKKPVRP
jgi:D-alanyl-D-alanine carboxypeptidase